VTYGYGVSPDQTIAVYLERDLRSASGSTTFRVINLAYNSEGAYSFKYTLRDYAYMDYDLAILFEGYNDLSVKQNQSVFRHDSPVFRMTGYMPILPLVFREKAAAMLHGDASALYKTDGKKVFRPTWTARAGAGALEATAAIEKSIEQQFDSVNRDRVDPNQSLRGNDEFGCGEWGLYCQSLVEAIDIVRGRGKKVIVGTQPWAGILMRAAHISQQQAMTGMLQRRYAADPNVKYLNLGDVLDVNDARLTTDGMHPTAEGNTRLAAAFTPAVLEMAKAAGH
jgi:hypothetical protein